jgi:hypothetical protein
MKARGGKLVDRNRQLIEAGPFPPVNDRLIDIEGVRYFAWGFAPLLASPIFMVRAAAVSILVVGGMLLFALFCQLTGAADFRRAIKLALRRP